MAGCTARRLDPAGRAAVTRWLVPALGALALLFTAACGSSSPAASPSPAKLTLQQVFELAAPATVEIHGKQGRSDVGGTGVIFDAAKGLVLTNAHVVAGVSSLKIRVGTQDETPARIVGTAPCEDVAVLTFSERQPGLKTIPFGDSDSVRNQDDVSALGYPASFADAASEKVVSTHGSVQSVNVAATPDKSLPHYRSTIQHSATINHGNSGGPLLNDRGELVGINTLTNQGTRSQSVQGQFYAISINHIKALLPDLIAGKNSANAGWDVSPFSEVPLSDVFEATGFGTAEEGRQADQLLAQHNVDGLFVFGSDAGSPADVGHLGFGDLITKVKGTPVTSVPEVCDILESASPGETLGVEGLYLTSGGTEHSFGDPWTTKVTLKG